MTLPFRQTSSPFRVKNFDKSNKLEKLFKRIDVVTLRSPFSQSWVSAFVPNINWSGKSPPKINNQLFFGFPSVGQAIGHVHEDLCERSR